MRQLRKRFTSLAHVSRWQRPESNTECFWYNYTIMNCLLMIFVHNCYAQTIYYTGVSLTGVSPLRNGNNNSTSETATACIWICVSLVVRWQCYIGLPCVSRSVVYTTCSMRRYNISREVHNKTSHVMFAL